VKGPTDTVASPVHRLFSSLTMSESVVQNIITASLYPEEEERMKIMKGLCLVMVKRERERENKDMDVVAVAVGRENRTRNDHWQ
jgi:predicted metal-dependent TIM-barrel fold hydrolase